MLYAIKDYDDKNIDRLADSIDSFGREVGAKLAELDQLSQNQIQIVSLLQISLSPPARW